jgi:hypothetical protein
VEREEAEERGGVGGSAGAGAGGEARLGRGGEGRGGEAEGGVGGEPRRHGQAEVRHVPA